MTIVAANIYKPNVRRARYNLNIFMYSSFLNILFKILILVIYVIHRLTEFNTSFNFDVLLTVHLSIFISVTNQIDAQTFCFTISLFHASTCFEHIRRSKLHYTASGIITLIGVMIPEAV